MAGQIASRKRTSHCTKNAFYCKEKFFDFTGIHVFAAANNQVFELTRDFVVSFLIHFAEVAGVKPTVRLIVLEKVLFESAYPRSWSKLIPAWAAALRSKLCDSLVHATGSDLTHHLIKTRWFFPSCRGSPPGLNTTTFGEKLSRFFKCFSTM